MYREPFKAIENKSSSVSVEMDSARPDYKCTPSVDPSKVKKTDTSSEELVPTKGKVSRPEMASAISLENMESEISRLMDSGDLEAKVEEAIELGKLHKCLLSNEQFERFSTATTVPRSFRSFLKESDSKEDSLSTIYSTLPLDNYCKLAAYLRKHLSQSQKDLVGYLESIFKVIIFDLHSEMARGEEYLKRRSHDSRYEATSNTIQTAVREFKTRASSTDFNDCIIDTTQPCHVKKLIESSDSIDRIIDKIFSALMRDIIRVQDRDAMEEKLKIMVKLLARLNSDIDEKAIKSFLDDVFKSRSVTEQQKIISYVSKMFKPAFLLSQAELRTQIVNDLLKYYDHSDDGFRTNIDSLFIVKEGHYKLKKLTGLSGDNYNIHSFKRPMSSIPETYLIKASISQSVMNKLFYIKELLNFKLNLMDTAQEHRWLQPVLSLYFETISQHFNTSLDALHYMVKESIVGGEIKDTPVTPVTPVSPDRCAASSKVTPVTPVTPERPLPTRSRKTPDTVPRKDMGGEIIGELSRAAIRRPLTFSSDSTDGIPEEGLRPEFPPRIQRFNGAA